MKKQIVLLTVGCVLGLAFGCGKRVSDSSTAPASNYLAESNEMDMEEAGDEAMADMAPAAEAAPAETPPPTMAATPAPAKEELGDVDADRAPRRFAKRRKIEATEEKARDNRMKREVVNHERSVSRSSPAASAVAEAQVKKRDQEAAAEQQVREERETARIRTAASVDKQLAPRGAQATLAKAKSAEPAQSATPRAWNPEELTRDNAFSTFSMNVSDVSFKLAAASLERQRLPERTSVRAEEFFNAMNYHDPAPASGEKLAFAWERASHPFAHNRDLIRFSIQTGASGREKNRPLNLVVLLDRSGSMERTDRALIVRRAMRSLAKKLTSGDRISVVAFARTARLCVDGMPGGDPDALLSRIDNLTPEGGTNLEAALDLGYEIAARHFRKDGVNRVILLTDGAANLGDVEPAALKLKAEAKRKVGIALDCFGIGWDGYNDELLEMLSRNADGRYGFLNDVKEAGEEFSEQLAGALQVAAANVKAQVEFNPSRVISYRQIGYEKRQLKKEQFRDNTVDAAEIGSAETGTGVYAVQIDRNGVGPLGVVRVRFLNPSTGLYEERSWTLFHRPNAPSLADSAASMRLAGCSALFAEWLAGSPYAGGVSLSELHACLAGASEIFANDPQPARLRRMVRQAQMIAGAAGES